MELLERQRAANLQREAGGDYRLLEPYHEASGGGRKLRFRIRAEYRPTLEAAGLREYFTTSGEAVVKTEFWLSRTADPATAELLEVFRLELIRARGRADYLESTHGDEGEGLYFRRVPRNRDDEGIEQESTRPRAARQTSR